MSVFPKALVTLFTLLLAGAAFAQERAPRQDLSVLRETVESFLHVQASGLPGQVSIAVGAIDNRLNLPACSSPEAFLAPGSRVWGNTTVGVRCTAPSPWNIYISATVRVTGEYVVAAAPLSQGQNIGPNDIRKIKGELTNLPPGVITNPDQAIGRTLTLPLSLGAPLRQDSLRTPQVVQQGQVVRLVTIGPGFQVSSEGRALNNANEGQMAKAKTPGGQVVSGLAKAGGIVEVVY